MTSAFCSRALEINTHSTPLYVRNTQLTAPDQMLLSPFLMWHLLDAVVVVAVKKKKKQVGSSG